MKDYLRAGAALLLCLLCLNSRADTATGDYTATSDDTTLVQVSLGVLELDDQSGNWDALSGDVDVDFSSLPVGGVEAEYVFYRGWVHAGLNPGASVAWKEKDTRISGRISGSGGNLLQVELDNYLLLAELHLGAYVRGRLHRRVTTYAAAGPMVVYGYHEVEDSRVQDGSEAPSQLADSDSSDVNVGYYARAGIDFEVSPGQHFGLGVRYLSSELDFNQTVGNIDIKGPQYMLTFSRRL